MLFRQSVQMELQFCVEIVFHCLALE